LCVKKFCPSWNNGGSTQADSHLKKSDVVQSFRRKSGKNMNTKLTLSGDPSRRCTDDCVVQKDKFAKVSGNGPNTYVCIQSDTARLWFLQLFLVKLVDCWNQNEVTQKNIRCVLDPLTLVTVNSV
jgi:hypothetical protein